MYFINYLSNSCNVRFYYVKKHTLIEIIRKDRIILSRDLLYPCKIDSPQYLAWPLISNLFLYASNGFPFFGNCFLLFHPLLLLEHWTIYNQIEIGTFTHIPLALWQKCTDPWHCFKLSLSTHVFYSHSLTTHFGTVAH